MNVVSAQSNEGVVRLRLKKRGVRVSEIITHMINRYPSPRLLKKSLLALGAVLSLTVAASAEEYTFKVVASGLSRPTGIVASPYGRLFFTEIPTPAVAGGANAVKELKLSSGTTRVIHQGEPEPTNITVDNEGVLYWTCKSAGVILEQESWPGAVAQALRTGLQKPSGIAISRRGTVYFTEVPTPGIPGSAGGLNRVLEVETDDAAPPVVVNQGEPEPTDIAVAPNGALYWTCKSAGVILTRTRKGEIKPLLTGLVKPVGIALDRSGRMLYWTEVPTPGVAGVNGGQNKVWEYDLRSGTKTLVNAGDPEPTDITVDFRGRLYWTCTSAGVIVEATPKKTSGSSTSGSISVSQTVTVQNGVRTETNARVETNDDVE